MKFTIDRSKWRCGGSCLYSEFGINGSGPTKLLNKDGFMCCLGFICEQSGVPKESLLSLTSPRLLDNPPVFLSYLNNNTLLTTEAIIINDNEHLSQEEREEKLKELFQKHGHKIEFIGNYIN